MGKFFCLHLVAKFDQDFSRRVFFIKPIEALAEALLVHLASNSLELATINPFKLQVREKLIVIQRIQNL